MPSGFSRIAIVGVGLIGGSIAAAAAELAESPEILGVDVDPESLDAAVDRGLLAKGATPDEAVAAGWFRQDGGVDLVVLATPARHVAEWLELLGTEGFRGIVTDVASTKSGVLEAARASLREPGDFVGGHPMAGSERSGVEAARADLFQGAYWLLTPAAETNMDVYRRLHGFVSDMGARVVSVDPAAHDHAVAIVSHVPHVAAAALVELAAANAGDRSELLRLAAGGFKDTTRIASGSPDLWTGICLDNAPAVASGLEELRDALGEFESALREGDAERVRAFLATAADVRRSLPAQWVPQTEQLLELRVPVLDRPGVVSEITGAVSSAGCNIEGIEIDHVSEDSAVLVMVLTDEGDFDALDGNLRARGFEPELLPLADAEAGDDA